MAIGPGKYDDAAVDLMSRLQADGVVILVANGNKGDGFAAVFNNESDFLHLASALRQVADQVERDIKQLMDSRLHPN